MLWRYKMAAVLYVVLKIFRNFKFRRSRIIRTTLEFQWNTCNCLNRAILQKNMTAHTCFCPALIQLAGEQNAWGVDNTYNQRVFTLSYFWLYAKVSWNTYHSHYNFCFGDCFEPFKTDVLQNFENIRIFLTLPCKII